MPVKHAIWKVADDPVPLAATTLAAEQQLEAMIVRAPSILSDEWMLIGRQETTGQGGRIDLLAIAPDASLVLIELKRNRTPREIVAQAIDYGSWVEQLTSDRIAQIYRRFSKGGDLAKVFRSRFGVELDEEALNQSHQIILVASALDDSTERIIGYLNARDIAINAVFFQVFQHRNEKLLSRAWLIDPGETQSNAVNTGRTKGERVPWNGEYYVSYGGGRSWDDARKFGFVSAGGDPWYSRTLNLLSPGDRIWVNVPRTGYVGVGRVTEPVQQARDFMVKTRRGSKSCFEVLRNGGSLRRTAKDPDKSEYFVRVDWADTTDERKALNEVGLFGNQNSVCRPTDPKWLHTVERLKKAFPRWDKTERKT